LKPRKGARQGGPPSPRPAPNCECALASRAPASRAQSRRFGAPWKRSRTPVGERTPPGNFRSAGSSRDANRWQRRGAKLLDVKGSYKRVSERAGPNMIEHRVSLETDNANADPVEVRGRLAGRGKRAKLAPRPYRRGSGEDMRAKETCGNTGNPLRREVKAPGQQPARDRLGRGGRRRGPYERGNRVMPAEQRGLSSRTATQAGKAGGLA